jgi:spore coat polysaccharide biosynthesis protein SpsF
MRHIVRKSNIGAIIQARMGSSRLPGKTMRLIQGKPILQHVIERVALAKSVDNIYVATTPKSQDDVIEHLCETLSIKVFRGSEENVLERLYLAAKYFEVRTIVRITADNPLVGPDVIDFLVRIHKRSKNNFTSNFHSRTFPNGTVLSVIDVEVLDFLTGNANSPNVREHVVTDVLCLLPRFKVEIIEAPKKWSRYDLRYSVDSEEDFVLVSRLIEHFRKIGMQPSTADIIRCLDENPAMSRMNHHLAVQGY